MNKPKKRKKQNKNNILDTRRLIIGALSIIIYILVVIGFYFESGEIDIEHVLILSVFFIPFIYAVIVSCIMVFGLPVIFIKDMIFGANFMKNAAEYTIDQLRSAEYSLMVIPVLLNKTDDFSLNIRNYMISLHLQGVLFANDKRDKLLIDKDYKNKLEDTEIKILESILRDISADNGIITMKNISTLIDNKDMIEKHMDDLIDYYTTELHNNDDFEEFKYKIKILSDHFGTTGNDYRYIGVMSALTSELTHIRFKNIVYTLVKGKDHKRLIARPDNPEDSLLRTIKYYLDVMYT